MYNAHWIHSLPYSKFIELTLIYGRNADWAKQMPGIMKQAPTLFVVGAGHLPGERGVLKLLEKQGYTVEAMH